jgi:hypothetical protein
VALLASCSDGNGPDGGQARVSVLLTDAPGDVTAAVVTISEVYLQGGAGGRVVLSDAPITVDLTTLAQTATELVSDAAVEGGTYQELRFVISGGYLEVENGDGSTSIYASSPSYPGLPTGATVDGDLQMPSLAQSGLKVDFGAAIDLSGETDLLVDFDVAQSFGKQAGQSGQWVMHPVIKGATLEAAATVTASIRLGGGVQLPSVGGSVLTLAAFKAKVGSEELAFGDPDADGVFTATFRFLLPGSYAVSIVGPAGITFTTSPTHPAAVTAEAGAEASVAFTVLTAALAT